MKLETTLNVLDAIWYGLISSLIALPIVLLALRWHGWKLYIATVVLGGVVLLLWQLWNWWAWRREIIAMKREADFAGWLDRVNARLRQYGYATKDRAEDDWLIDFEAGLTPDQAAKNVSDAGRAFTE